MEELKPTSRVPAPVDSHPVKMRCRYCRTESIVFVDTVRYTLTDIARMLDDYDCGCVTTRRTPPVMPSPLNTIPVFMQPGVRIAIYQSPRGDNPRGHFDLADPVGFIVMDVNRRLYFEDRDSMTRLGGQRVPLLLTNWRQWLRGVRRA